MSKIIIVSFLLVVVWGCTSSDYLKGEYYVTGINFTKYTKDNFLITPLLYNGDYNSIGTINIHIMPDLISAKRVNKMPEGYHEYDIGQAVYYEQDISVQNAVDSLYNIAKRMGADAIINFKADYAEKDLYAHTIYGYNISGFAIKRSGTAK